MGAQKEEYVLKWRGESKLPIIKYVLEFQQENRIKLV